MDPINPQPRKLTEYDFSVLNAQQRLRLVIEDAISQNIVFSKSDFAEKLRLPPYALSRLLSGEHAITPSVAATIESVFGIPESWLLQGIDNQKP